GPPARHDAGGVRRGRLAGGRPRRGDSREPRPRCHGREELRGRAVARASQGDAPPQRGRGPVARAPGAHGVLRAGQRQQLRAALPGALAADPHAAAPHAAPDQEDHGQAGGVRAVARCTVFGAASRSVRPAGRPCSRMAMPVCGALSGAPVTSETSRGVRARLSRISFAQPAMAARAHAWPRRSVAC
ncbi:unnamed protein product, partial [Prorocentrum cordatum]